MPIFEPYVGPRPPASIRPGQPTPGVNLPWGGSGSGGRSTSVWDRIGDMFKVKRRVVEDYYVAAPFMPTPFTSPGAPGSAPSASPGGGQYDTGLNAPGYSQPFVPTLPGAPPVDETLGTSSAAITESEQLPVGYIILGLLGAYLFLRR